MSIVVSYADTATLSEETLSACMSRLPNADQARLQGVKHPGRRRESLLGRVMLRSRLAELYGPAAACWPVEVIDGGKPLLRPGAEFDGAVPDFSISHSSGWVAVVVADFCRVGLDIEHQAERRNLEGLIGYVLNPAERAWVRSAGQAEVLSRFFRLWTLKEAFAKVEGAGIAATFKALDLTAVVSKPSVFEDARADLFAELTGGNFRGGYLCHFSPAADFSAALVLTGLPEDARPRLQLRPFQLESPSLLQNCAI